MSGQLRAWWPTILFVPIVIAAFRLNPDLPLVESVVNLIVYSAFSITGSWIVLRSGNRMGRVFQALALVSAMTFLTDSYLVASLAGATGRALAGFDLAVVLAEAVLFVPFFVLSFVLPFLLFPTGRPHSQRWGYVLTAVLVWVGAVTVATFIGPIIEVDDEFGGNVANPWAVDALAAPAGLLTDQLFNVITLLGLLAVASLAFRYRAAGPEERAQIRWFLLAGVFLIFALILDEVVLDALPVHSALLEQTIELVGMLVGLLGLPVATGIAILKYRLYDVDVVINRTLVYGSLTLLLAALYGGLVVGLQRLLPAVTRDSDLAVAAATLAVAGAFGPLRMRIQAFIDRRFYRARYDTATTLSVFASHVRDQVDLDSLSDELVRVVGSTMQPAHASLWLRAEGRP